MIEVNYLFYREKYEGTIIPAESSFKQPLLKANIYLRQLLHKEVDDTDEELAKLCLCEVADLIYQDSVAKQEYGGREVQSENTDGYSVSYVSTDASSLEERIYHVIDRYLSHTGLLYLGVE